MLPGSDIQGWWEQERQGSGRAFFPMPADHTSAMERSSECNLRLSTNSREFWWCWVSDVCMDWKEGRGNMGGEREGCARCSCVHSSWWHLVTNRMLEAASTPNQTAFWSNSLLCCWNAPAVLKQQSSADVTHWKHRVCLAVSVCVLLQMQLQYLCVSAGGEGLQGNVGVLGKMGKQLVSSGSRGGEVCGWRSALLLLGHATICVHLHEGRTEIGKWSYVGQRRMLQHTGAGSREDAGQQIFVSSRDQRCVCLCMCGRLGLHLKQSEDGKGGIGVSAEQVMKRSCVSQLW